VPYATGPSPRNQGRPPAPPRPPWPDGSVIQAGAPAGQAPSQGPTCSCHGLHGKRSRPPGHHLFGREVRSGFGVLRGHDLGGGMAGGGACRDLVHSGLRRLPDHCATRGWAGVFRHAGRVASRRAGQAQPPGASFHPRTIWGMRPAGGVLRLRWLVTRPSMMVMPTPGRLPSCTDSRIVLPGACCA
jgi:hypothetical protein